MFQLQKSIIHKKLNKTSIAVQDHVLDYYNKKNPNFAYFYLQCNAIQFFLRQYQLICKATEKVKMVSKKCGFFIIKKCKIHLAMNYKRFV